MSPPFPSQLGEADGSDGAAPSPRGGYRPQGRWAACAEHGPIKTLPEAEPSCFTPVRSSDLEGDAELEPRNLEQLLLEAGEGPEPPAGLSPSPRLPLWQADASPGSLVESSRGSELFLEDETQRELDLPDTTEPSLDEPCSQHSTPEASRFLLPRGDTARGSPPCWGGGISSSGQHQERLLLGCVGWQWPRCRFLPPKPLVQPGSWLCHPKTTSKRHQQAPISF